MDGVIYTPEQLKREVEYFLKQDAFVFDVESMDGVIPGTRGIPTQNQIVWLSLSTYGRNIIIPMGHPNGNNLLRKGFRKKNPETKKMDWNPAVYDAPPKQMRPSEVFAILEPLFFSDLIKGAHNAPFDVISIAKYLGGRIIPGPIFCTLTMQWIKDENIGQFSGGPRRPVKKDLKTLTSWYYGVKYDHNEVGKCIELHPFKDVARYALLDSAYTWLLLRKFRRSIPEEALQAIWELEQAVTPVVCRMGLVGAPVDVQAIRELDVYLTDLLVGIETRVYQAAGKQFNIGSWQQKQDILYKPKTEGGQGLKPTRLNKSGKLKKQKGIPLSIRDYSTDKDALDDFVGNPLVDVLLEYSEIDKLRSTYVRAYLGVEGDSDKPCLIFNGRIHTDLVQYGTVTGRFSSRAPNLQNIPNPESELGSKVRGLFRAPEGYRLLVADYAQMELRILASMIGYGGLYDGFMAGIDAHTQTAVLVYNKQEEFAKDPDYMKHPENMWMRSAAKTLNFAIVYGAGAAKVAATIGISVEEAQQLLDNHKVAFPEVYEFRDKIMALARSRRKSPYIRTILGRKRRVWEVLRNVAEIEAPKLPWYEPQKHQAAVRSVISRGERQVFNSLVQGSLGDIIKLAMVRMDKVLSEDAVKNPGREIQMILSVHDELVLLCPEDRVAEGSAMLLEAMIGKEIQDLIKVPLDIGKIAVVQRWSQAKE